MIDKTSKAKLEVLVPDYAEGTHIQTQYGCRYPDGRVEWGSWTDYGNTPWGFASMIVESSAPYNTKAVERWKSTLARRAEAAKINEVDYVEEHRFIKRTVILVTTKAEDVA